MNLCWLGERPGLPLFVGDVVQKIRKHVSRLEMEYDLHPNSLECLEPQLRVVTQAVVGALRIPASTGEL